MKNFCSSLFGPSCTTETCPNQNAKIGKKGSNKKKENKKPNKKYQSGTQTVKPKETKKEQTGVQTWSHKDIDTQLANETQIQADMEVRHAQNAEENLEDTPEARLEKERLEVLEKCEREKERLDKERAQVIEECKREQERLEKLRIKMIDKCKKERDALKECERINKPVDDDEPEIGPCKAPDCAKYCEQAVQYDVKDSAAAKEAKKKEAEKAKKEKRDKKEAAKKIKAQKAKEKKEKEMRSKAVETAKCACDQAVQIYVRKKKTCTCATQHECVKKNAGTEKGSSFMVESLTFENRSPVANKKTQYTFMNKVADKSTYHTTQQRNVKSGLDADSSTSKPHQKLSLESSLCVMDHKPSEPDGVVQDILTDTITDTSFTSSVSTRSDETKTDTTICSLATVDFDDTPRRRKFRVKVVTKTNQATITDKTRLCDTGTITHDWWSPIVERKANDRILLEKKKGFNTIEKQKKELRELKEWKELNEVRKRRRNCGVTTDGRIVTFRSRTQIIPTGLLAPNDIMSPARYLLESQKYYNELFAYNFRPPHQVGYTCVNQSPKYQEREKPRSPLGTRRNHHRKTKRLEECYSPRRPVSTKKRHGDSTKTSDSARRRPYPHRHTTNRHHCKWNSPRKIV